MLIDVSNVILGVVALILVIIMFLITSIFIYTSLYKNKKLMILNINHADDTLKELYGSNLKKIIDGDFIKNIEEEYQKVFENFNKGLSYGNIIYKSKYQQGKKILITINMINSELNNEITSNLLHIHGNQVKNSKSLFYVIIEAIDLILKKEQLNINLSILLLNNQNENVIEGLENHYDLVLNENSEILDPITSKLRSYYAFVGNLSTGLAAVNFTSEKIGNGKCRINEFIKVVSRDFNKSNLSNPILKILHIIGKDMIFSDRIVALNPIIFKPFALNLIHESKFKFIYGVKTKIKFNEIITSDETYSCLANIELGINRDLVNMLKKLNPYLSKYGITYEIIENVEQSKYVNIEDKNYRIIEKAIKETFKDIYVSPAIVEGSKFNNFDFITDSSISFSPLYYSHNAKINYSKGVEYVSCGSLVYGVEFYSRLLEEYIRRNKCIVDFVEEK